MGEVVNESGGMTLDDALRHALELAKQDLAQAEAKLPIRRAKVAALAEMNALWADAKQGIVPGRRRAVPAAATPIAAAKAARIAPVSSPIPDVPISERFRAEDFVDCDDVREVCFQWANLHDGWCFVGKMADRLIGVGPMSASPHGVQVGLGRVLSAMVENGHGERVGPGVYRLHRLEPIADRQRRDATDEEAVA